MEKRFFTLVELLVVIGIIAILAAIILPAIDGAIKKADKTKAKAEITTLVNAIKQYESTYHKLPIPADVTSDTILTEEQYKWLIRVLQGQKSTSSPFGATHGTYAQANRRDIKFLDIVGNNPGEYKDPWDNDYQVIFDTDYDGKIEAGSNGIPGLVGKTEDSKQVYYYSLIIYSKGSDGDVDDEDIDNAKNKDNVYSVNTTWEKNTGHTISK